MNRPSLFYSRIFGLTFILAISSHGISYAQNVNWGQSYGRSTIMAKEKYLKLVRTEFE